MHYWFSKAWFFKVAFYFGIVYAGIGLMWVMLALVDLFDEDKRMLDDEELKWWHIPRAFLFCFFLAPGMTGWFVVEQIGKSVWKKWKLRKGE